MFPFCYQVYSCISWRSGISLLRTALCMQHGTSGEWKSRHCNHTGYQTTSPTIYSCFWPRRRCPARKTLESQVNNHLSWKCNLHSLHFVVNNQVFFFLDSRFVVPMQNGELETKGILANIIKKEGTMESFKVQLS